MVDSVELILKTISTQHSTESPNNDQPDYDSVASDEDPDADTTASRASRQKVRGHASQRGVTITLRILSPTKWPDVSVTKAVEIKLGSLLAWAKPR